MTSSIKAQAIVECQSVNEHELKNNNWEDYLNTIGFVNLTIVDYF